MILIPIEKINCETAQSGMLCADCRRKNVCMCSIFTLFEANIVPIEKGAFPVNRQDGTKKIETTHSGALRADYCR